MATSKATNATSGGGMPPWLVFSSGLVAGLIVGVLVMNLMGGPGGGSRTSTAPAPVTPQQQGPDRVKLMRDIAQLEDIVKKDPGNYQAWVQLGNDRFDLQEAQRSVEAYRKALAIRGDDPNVWTDMGIMYRDLKNFPEAIASFRKGAAIGPTHPESRLNLGVVYLHDLNDIPSAIAAWEDFLRVERPGPRADSIRKQLEQMRGMAAGAPAGAPAGTGAPAGVPGGGAADLDRAAAELQKKLDAASGR